MISVVCGHVLGNNDLDISQPGFQERIRWKENAVCLLLSILQSRRILHLEVFHFLVNLSFANILTRSSIARI